MAEPLAPIEQDLWYFALACTNSARGAARVVASLARDHRELGRVSEARLRRDVLARSVLWETHPESAGDQPLHASLKVLDPFERAALWLDAGPGLSVAEIAWICDQEPVVARGVLDGFRDRLDGVDLRSVFDEIDRTDLTARLGASRETASRRERRRAAVLIIALAVFVALMGAVMLDLLDWRSAEETLPGRVEPIGSPEPSP